MTKTMVIMEELVKVTITTVIPMTYRRNNMEKKNNKNKTKLELIKKLVR